MRRGNAEPLAREGIEGRQAEARPGRRGRARRLLSRHARPRGPGAGRSKRPSTRSCPRPRSRASSTGRSPGRCRRSIARSLVRHRVFERIAAELAASGELERLVTGALRSPQTLELTDKVLASDEMQSAIRPCRLEPRAARRGRAPDDRARRGVVGGLRASAVRLDDRAERVLHRPPRREPSPYGGIATRAIALATDGLLTVVLFMSVVGIASLVASLVGGLRPEWLVGVLLGSGWMLVVGVYFVLFWSTAGQTPGMRLLHLRVRGPGGRHAVGRSLARAPRRARARDRAVVRGLPAGAVHRAAPRPPGLPRGNRRRLRLAARCRST